MKKPARILAACDDSPQAADVADYAAYMASGLAARLILARIIPKQNVEAVHQAFIHMPDLNKDPNEAVSEYIREERKNGRQALNRLLGRLYRDLNVETVVRVGVPYEALLDIVYERKIDIVVVGTSKHNAMLDRIMGSTVSHLLRRCPVPLVGAKQAGVVPVSHQADREMHD